MTDPNPRELARAVVLEALRSDVQLFVALQYLGLIDQAQLHQMFGADLADHTVVDAEAETVYVQAGADGRPEYTVVSRPERRSIQRFPEPTRGYRADPPTDARSLFARWMEREIPWSPAVMGWAEDDPQVAAMREVAE